MSLTINPYSFKPLSLPLIAIDCAGDIAGVAIAKPALMAKAHPVLLHRSFPANQATTHLIPAIEALMIEADIPLKAIAGIVWNAGPGSFTGLRIAAGVVQGFAVACAIPVVAVEGFEAWIAIWNELARFICPEKNGIDQAQSLSAIMSSVDAKAMPNTFLCAMDARAMEVYWRIFHKTKTGYQPLTETRVDKPDVVQEIIQARNINPPDMGFGTGFSTYPMLCKALANPSLCIGQVFTEPLFQAHLSAMVEKALRGNMNIDKIPEDGRMDLPVYVRHQVAKTLTEQAQWQEKTGVKY